MGCSWQGRNRQQLRESVSAKPLLNLALLTPLAGCLWGPSLVCPPTTPKGKENKDKSKMQHARRLCDPEGPLIDQVNTLGKLFRVTDSWGNMKGHSIREKLELEALFLTKECEHEGWCVLCFFELFPLFPSVQGCRLNQAKAGTEMLKPWFRNTGFEVLGSHRDFLRDLGQVICLCCTSASNP